MSDYILADDLSGALETGAAFRARGFRVTLPIDPAADVGIGEDGIQVVSTETRAASPERAAGVVRELVAAREAAGSRLLFKKIDSTLRGPIGAEIEAIRSVLEPPVIVVCPANPGARRVVRGGMLLVDGVPLAETEFKDDPQWPARSSRVGEVLESQGLSPAGGLSLDAIRAGRASASFAASIVAGARVVIADAETDDDLQCIAATVRMSGRRALLIGSGALGAAIAGEMPPGTEPSTGERLGDCSRVLVLCGSANPRSHDQLHYLAERVGIPVIPFVVGESDGDQAAADVATLLRARGIAAVRFTSASGPVADCAQKIQESIGEWTRLHTDAVAPDCIFLTGGETAWTVCRQMGGASLKVIGELVPGVVLSSLIRRRARSILVATKPGGFGARACLLDAFAQKVK